MNAQGEPWALVVLDLCSQGEVAAVMPAAGKEEGLVSLTLDRAPLVEALRSVGELRGMEPIYRDGVVSFRPIGVGSVGVVQPGFLSADDAKVVVQAVVGSGGAVNQAGPNIVVSGNAEAVDRSAKMSELFAANEPGQWLISVWLVETSNEVRDRLGIELSVTGTLQGLIGGGPAAAAAQAILTGTMDAKHGRSFAHLLNEATVVLVEGHTASVRNVTSVPVPQRSVGSFGNVQTTGYTFIEAGLILELAGRSVPGGGLYLDIKPELSSVTGLVGDAPIVSKRSMQMSAMIGDGDWCILAGLDQWAKRAERNGLLEFLHVDDASDSSILVILRASRVERRGHQVTAPVFVGEIPKGLSEPVPFDNLGGELLRPMVVK